MRIGVIGAGYVGLVTGTCLAEMGNRVTIVDIDAHKIAMLRKAQSPHYEPGLAELLARNIAEKRLFFSCRPADAVRETTAIFIAVGTPQDEQGAADLSYLEQAVRDIAAAMRGYRLVIIKSTVPAGTNRRMEKMLRRLTRQRFDLVSNPEFLKEGAAIDDFMRPDRIVIGVRSQRAALLMKQIYAPFVRTGQPILIVDPESAEMIKYVANALLASRISFMNEMAWICSAVGADIDLVRIGVGADKRIGPSFLFPGLGYGGSCFPKDVRALACLAESLGLKASLCRAIDEVNVKQWNALFPFIEREFGADLRGRRFALWGLAFKPRTDDVREAPALHVARELVRRGAAVTAFDPVAMPSARKVLGREISYARSLYEALDRADALVIATEWNEFRTPDFSEFQRRMRQCIIFDGRNIYDPAEVEEAGLAYYGIGRGRSLARNCHAKS
ncbi:MAG: UDP-glucose/GDP-mannose dehydrogenase family protein, partial [Planctomycetota bacterium]|nr:UDP-glucose/GDP-mannose dehydrogenase family protein [Planctomycetota bacterium]